VVCGYVAQESDVSGDPERYEVRVNGEHITCAPAEKVPLAQRYFLF